MLKKTKLGINSRNSARRGFLALGSNGKSILGSREEKIWTTRMYTT
jgi:hypothetical protein